MDRLAPGGSGQNISVHPPVQPVPCWPGVPLLEGGPPQPRQVKGTVAQKWVLFVGLVLLFYLSPTVPTSTMAFCFIFSSFLIILACRVPLDL